MTACQISHLIDGWSASETKRLLRFGVGGEELSSLRAASPWTQLCASSRAGSDKWKGPNPFTPAWWEHFSNGSGTSIHPSIHSSIHPFSTGQVKFSSHCNHLQQLFFLFGTFSNFSHLVLHI